MFHHLSLSSEQFKNSASFRTSISLHSFSIASKDVSTGESHHNCFFQCQLVSLPQPSKLEWNDKEVESLSFLANSSVEEELGLVSWLFKTAGRSCVAPKLAQKHLAAIRSKKRAAREAIPATKWRVLNQQLSQPVQPASEGFATSLILSITRATSCWLRQSLDS